MMVIPPEVVPLEVGPGEPLPVRVLVDGKPAAGVELVGDYRSALHQVRRIASNPQLRT